MSSRRFVRPPFLLRLLCGKHLVFSLPSEGKPVYITFDDGPVPGVTTEVLKILETYGVKATFFMVGDNVRKHPELYEQVKEAGHTIGNHTFHHLNGWHTSPAAYVEDVNRCDGLLHSPLFRPPYGRMTPSQYFLLRKKYRIILWSVLTKDYARNTSPEECLENAIRYTESGSIVVFHDSLKAKDKVLFALPRYLSYLQQNNYSTHTPTSTV